MTHESFTLKPQPGMQERFSECSADIAICGGSAGAGKRGDIAIKVPTERGWTTLGDIKVGDRIFAIDGSVTTVYYVSPIEIAQDAFEVEFDTGEKFVVDGEHLWKTMTDKERVEFLHLDDEWRAKRRSSRPSRAKPERVGTKSNFVITKNNRERVHDYKEKPSGEVRTTFNIADTLVVRGNRVNHSVDVAQPIDLEENQFLLNPYLLGVWLGDGCSTSGLIGGLVEDIDEMKQYFKCEIVSESIETKNRKQPYKNIRIRGFYNYLRTHNLIKNKHIPVEYLRGSIDQRIDLLRGLMDTDGTCCKKGSCSIMLSNKTLIEDVHHLISSLGIKSSITIKKVKGYGDSYRICFVCDFFVFNLTRKRIRQELSFCRKRSQTKNRRYIVSVRQVEPRAMRCIAIDHSSHLYLIGETFIPTHNTFALLLEPLYFVNNPNFDCVIFRRESKQVTTPGGIRDEALNMYVPLGAEYRASPTPQFIFPSGAKVTFGHLNQEQEVVAWHGSQIALICFDELCMFTEHQFFYMLSRNRSTCGVRPTIRCTCNPDSDSWVAQFISWWIDQETGYPIPELSGVLRYMIRIDGKIVWGSSRQDLVDRYGIDPDDAKSVTFIPGRITENPALLRADPGYLANLKAMSYVERSRLLDGNWKIRACAGMYFPRYDAVLIDWKPTEVVQWIRSWDLAASEVTDGKRVDYTVGMLVGRRPNGHIVIGDVIRVQRRASDVRELVRRTAENDGRDVWIALPQDPGQSGKDQVQSYKELLRGYSVLTRSITKNKILMAEPAAAQWQVGHVEIVRGKWNEELLLEFEQFPEALHDDQVDAFAAACNRLPGAHAPDYSKSGLSDRFRSLRQTVDRRKSR